MDRREFIKKSAIVAAVGAAAGAGIASPIASSMRRSFWKNKSDKSCEGTFFLSVVSVWLLPIIL